MVLHVILIILYQVGISLKIEHYGAQTLLDLKEKGDQRPTKPLKDHVLNNILERMKHLSSIGEHFHLKTCLFLLWILGLTVWCYYWWRMKLDLRVKGWSHRLMKE